MAEAKAYAEKVRQQAATTATLLDVESDARLSVSQKKSAALITEAEAESSQAQNLENKRNAIEKMTMSDALTKMARSQKIVIGGESGE